MVSHSDFIGRQNNFGNHWHRVPHSLTQEVWATGAIIEILHVQELDNHPTYPFVQDGQRWCRRYPRMAAYLLLPRGGKEHYQTVVYSPSGIGYLETSAQPIEMWFVELNR